MAQLRTGSYGTYYGSIFTESEALSSEQQTINARYIFSFLTDKGWTVNAISALLGNMQAESSINSGRWQSDDVGNYNGGYGLVQWTPVTKYTEWCSEKGYADPSEMDANLNRILYEVENHIQWIATSRYPFTFKEFTESFDHVANLAKAFLLNYERPANQSTQVQYYRATLAESWYKTLSGFEPSTPPIKKADTSRLLIYAMALDDFWY